MDNILQSVELGIEMARYADTLLAKTNAVIAKVSAAKEEYVNTDIPEDRDTIMLTLINGNEDIYTLTTQDTTVVPPIIKTSGELTLREALTIYLCAEDPAPSDIATALSNSIIPEDLVQTDNMLTLDNVKVRGVSAYRVRDLFDIREFMHMVDMFKRDTQNVDWDRMEIALGYLNRYKMLMDARLV